MICVGYTAASWIGFGFYFVNASGAQWRLPLAIQALPPLFLSVGVLFLPESPRWLIDRDRMEDAYDAFKAVRAETTDNILNNEDAIQEEFKLLQGQIAHERQNALSLIDLWRIPSYRKRCIVGFITLFGCRKYFPCRGAIEASNYRHDISHTDAAEQRERRPWSSTTMDLCYMALLALAPSSNCSFNLGGSQFAHSATCSMPWWSTESVVSTCSSSVTSAVWLP